MAQETEDLLRLVVETIPAMVWSVRPDGVVDFLNKRWLDYTGLTLEEYVNEPLQVIHPEDIPDVMEKWAADLTAGRTYEDEMRLRRADGEFRWFLVRTVPLLDSQGNVVKWYGTSTDIDDQKRAEYAMRDAASQLEALSRRLVNLQESERKDLAREMHDRLGPNLTSLGINLSMLEAALPSNAADEMRARLADSQTLIESTADAVRDILAELRPQMLDEHGLVAALIWYVRRVSSRTSVSVAVNGQDLTERPAPEIEIALFRIAQEALNNVIKHAQASSVEIAVERSGSGYAMSVKDDGVGFDAAEDREGSHTGFGMVTMRERAQAVGGSFEVQTFPGGGTKLTVRVPG
jgi:two-component system sensor histidine kinase UhpB